MSVPLGARVAVALPAALLVAALPGRAVASPARDARLARAGLKAAVQSGRVEPADAARYRAIVARTARALPRLGGRRHTELAGVLADVAAQSRRYTRSRALTLFSMLDVDMRYFAAHDPPKVRGDVLGPDLVLYRYFPGHGLQFHPLGVFGALNAHLVAGRLDEARRLADALAARAISGSGGSVWEYSFAYGGGRPPWTSGMAQAVAAQALARASERLGEPSYLALARRAAAPVLAKLTRQLPAGPWVRLYSFSDAVILNAQLQTAVALQDYADIAHDDRAAALADGLRRSAAAMLPRFETGYWSRYSLGGAESPLEYHDYVVYLLDRLAGQTDDAFWSDALARFRAYSRQPPAFELGAPAAPVAGGSGTGTFASSIWISKRSDVTVQVAGGSRTLSLSGGWHRLTWTLPRSRPGIFAVTLRARPIAGPAAEVDLSPLVVLGKAA